MTPRLPLFSLLALLGLALLPLSSAAQEPSILKYKGRYESQPGVDKMQGVAIYDADHVAVVSASGLSIVDRQAMDAGTIEDYVARYAIDAFEPSNLDGAPPGDKHYTPKFFHIVAHPPYLYVTTRFDGLWIFRVESVDGQIQEVVEVSRLLRPREFTEGLAILGTKLFLTHHLDGVEVLELLPNPEQPQSLATFNDWDRVDAWGIEPQEDGTVWVAGGRGGAHLLLYQDGMLTRLGGDSFGTSPGTVLDLAAVGTWVVAAVGGQGLTVYDRHTAVRMGTYPVPGVCVDIKSVSDTRLVVACRGWVHAVEVTPAGELEILASRQVLRRVSDLPQHKELSFHIAAGVAVDRDSVYVAGWHHLDALELVADDPDDDADLEIDGQRVQFPGHANTMFVDITNSGEGVLELQPPVCEPTVLECDLDSPFVDPGQSALLTVDYEGSGGPNRFDLDLHSNDPGDSPARVLVLFPVDDRVDPGEPAPDFSGTLLRRDYEGETFVERALTLSTRTAQGRPAHFVIFGSWCPACVPAAVSMASDVHRDLPAGADFFLVNPEGLPELLQHVLEKIYIPMGIFMDDDGSVNDLYSQPKVGVPFGRGYVVDQSGTVTLVSVRYEPARVLEEISRLLP